MYDTQTASTTDVNLSIFADKLDVNGAAAILYGDKDQRYQGLVLWSLAIKLRSTHKITQAVVEQTVLEKRVSNGKTEAAKFEDLKALLRQRRKHWIGQAVLKTQHVFKKKNCYPNHFVVDSFYTSLMKGWEKRNSTQDNTFFQVLFMIELADIHLLKRRPIIEIVDPILMVLNELQKVLKTPSVTFKKLMVCLSCETRFNLQEGGTPNAATA